jgi:hypothetical protein
MIEKFERFLQSLMTMAIDCGYPNLFLGSIAVGAAAAVVLLLQFVLG